MSQRRTSSPANLKLAEEDRRELLPSGGTFKFSSRVSWARTYLQKAGLLEASKRGHFRITDRGWSVLKSKPDRIDVELLSQFEEFREFQGRKKERKDEKAKVSVSSETPIESIATQCERLREALASELLERVKKSSPQFFEGLVILLLVRMGYGGSLLRTQVKPSGKVEMVESSLIQLIPLMRR